MLERTRTPTTRDEAWRFFAVGDIVDAKLVFEENDDDVDEKDLRKMIGDDVPENAVLLTFVNGSFVEKFSRVFTNGSVSVSRDCIDDDFKDLVGTFDEDLEIDQQGAVFARMNKAQMKTLLSLSVCASADKDNNNNNNNNKDRCVIYIVHARKSLKDRKDGELAINEQNARIFIKAQENSSFEIVEKYATLGEGKKKHDSRYWANDVLEISLGKNAQVSHSLSQNHGREAVHTRATFVRQHAMSKYEINEVNVGAKLHRHDLRVKQFGEKTDTKLNCFNLAGAKQTLDLHSAIVLDFEEGTTDQRHRCIVSSSSGKGVFDGNVRVNKTAQRTDAKQITRNLLLVPKATVNCRPNLQIVADDVKCTHGCTVSDLEEEELFYIQSRGLTKEIARSLLVSGFGTEIISNMCGGVSFKEYVKSTVKDALQKDSVELLQ